MNTTVASKLVTIINDNGEQHGSYDEGIDAHKLIMLEVPETLNRFERSRMNLTGTHSVWKVYMFWDGSILLETSKGFFEYKG